MTLYHLEALDAGNLDHRRTAAELWNAACGPDLAITVEGVCYNTQPTPGTRQAGRLALIGARAVGFVLATEFSRGDAQVSPLDMGWLDAIAVAPSHAGRGVGSDLLRWAEGWLAAAGCTRVRLGGSLRPFAPGLPSGLPAEGFFRTRGYTNRASGPVVWDMARDMRSYQPPASLRAVTRGDIHAAHDNERAAVAEFFAREFPGRWEYEQRCFLDAGGRLSDLTVLELNGRVEGFAWLTFEDSRRPLDRVFMHRLARPWGHLGPIGVSKGLRGGGFGAALLDAGLRRLRDAGVAGCVIDWTELLDFYGRFGFTPHRQYEMMSKAVA